MWPLNHEIVSTTRENRFTAKTGRITGTIIKIKQGWGFESNLKSLVRDVIGERWS